MARPQKLSDAQILAVVKSLRAAKVPVTGVAVRRQLQRRFGVRAGTDRLYALLRASHTPNKIPAPPNVTDPGELVRERDAALQRAKLAEYREEATQMRTALEIDSLRERLRALGVDPFSADRLSRSRVFSV